MNIEINSLRDFIVRDFVAILRFLLFKPNT